MAADNGLWVDPLAESTSRTTETGMPPGADALSGWVR